MGKKGKAKKREMKERQKIGESILFTINFPAFIF